ncbi:glycosyltransferase family 2 protein [Saccharicrinis sp. FJH54]|uniref:glycosyltransferase family 2 protein n=1 Tax=Saccharicrinis sp. FJH54 TaxID=3344665 RepID=UPI0035D49717
MVSIIIPTYNRSNLIISAVNSCLHQTYKNIEIIIVDDGSSDDTENLVSQQLNSTWQGFNIRYIKQDNAGASAARNHGLKQAKGDYIQFLDSDDQLMHEKLELQIKKIHETNADGCSCYGLMGETIHKGFKIGEAFESKLDLLHELCSGRVHVMQTSAPLWKKSALEKNVNWNTQLGFGDDLEYHVRVVSEINKMVFIPETLFFLRVHKADRLSEFKGNLEQIESGIRTQQSIVRTLNDANLWDKASQKGILKASRTLYANYLSTATKLKMQDFEKWMIKCSLNPRIHLEIIALILFRKLLGTRLLLKIYQAIK